ncbi:MAG: hypothetical protein J7M14_00835 [Planctomycetes bacterium]|nr:hypothetical protein [Planctomycetota bacterium]
MPRVAVFVPELYQGGTLRAAKDLAKMVQHAAALRGDDVDVVLGYRPGVIEAAIDLADLADRGIPSRECSFKIITAAQLEQAARLRGIDVKADNDIYCLAGDGANDFLDCDLWVLVSDRLQVPLAPLRPYGVLVFDCIQRYVPQIWKDEGWALQTVSFMPLLRNADFVMATTPATIGDLNSFIGVPRRKLHQMPMFFDPLAGGDVGRPRLVDEDYFVWTSNSTPHKNHKRVLKALELYYDKLGGTFRTCLIGRCTEDFRPHKINRFQKSDPEYAARIRAIIENTPCLEDKLDIKGYPCEEVYLSTIAGARFLLHANLYDNGTFSVLDAACLSVPSLSARYPAMTFMDERFKLNLTMFDPYDTEELAEKLKWMEDSYAQIKLPDESSLRKFGWESAAEEFYDLFRPYLKV